MVLVDNLGILEVKQELWVDNLGILDTKRRGIALKANQLDENAWEIGGKKNFGKTGERGASLLNNK